MHDSKKALDSVLSDINSEAKTNCRLVVVSKKKSPQQIRELSDYGHKDFGENYVQEFLEKYELLKAEKICWHFIGQLQTNKVKQIVGKVSLIHSVDSLKLLEEINKRSQNSGLIQEVLVQVSFDKSENRGGISEENLRDIFKKSNDWKNIKIKGLMTVPPVEKDYSPRPYFEKLSKLLLQIREEFGFSEKDFYELSMGMSSDYIDAIGCGSTLVRVGSKILGER